MLLALSSRLGVVDSFVVGRWRYLINRKLPVVAGKKVQSIIMAAAHSKRTAVIFDYDWTLINCNSDTFIFEQLWPERPAVVQELSKAGLQWTKAVDQAFQLLHEHVKPTTQQILDTVAHVPVQDGMLDAVRYAHEHGAALFIVSDANTAFIEAFLQAKGIRDLFQNIVSNKAVLDGERFSVQPYYDYDHLPPHACPCCPMTPNMCKGSILTKDLDVFSQFDRVIYLGDGGGDYCACHRLRPGCDYALARRNLMLANLLAEHSTEAKQNFTHLASEYPVKATVKLWESGVDVFNLLQEILGSD